MPELDHHPEDESHYDCEFCRDTGKLDGSDYYDCAHCSIAQERVKLEERMGNMKRSMPTNDATWSLVKSERKRVLAVQAAELALLKSNLLQKERELAEVRKDAGRYRFLRGCDWFSSPLCVLSEPKKAVDTRLMLGADFPSRERLDAAIDAAMSNPNKGESK
jgi:hypothetical protein